MKVWVVKKDEFYVSWYILIGSINYEFVEDYRKAVLFIDAADATVLQKEISRILGVEKHIKVVSLELTEEELSRYA